MPTLLNTGTRDIPLQFAKQLTEIVNQKWEQGTFMQKVSPQYFFLIKMRNHNIIGLVLYINPLFFYYQDKTSSMDTGA